MKKFLYFLPIFVLCLSFLLTGCTNTKDIFITKVLSSSMEASGINRGDYVMIKKINISKIEENDIILYYHSSLKNNNESSKELLSEIKFDNTKDFKSGQKKYNSSLILHQVISVYYDVDGNTWFETKGSSNDSADTTLTRADYVVGKYVKVYKRGDGSGGSVEFSAFGGK